MDNPSSENTPSEKPPSENPTHSVFKGKITYDENARKNTAENATFYRQFKKSLGGINRVLFEGFKESLLGKEEIDESILDDIEEFLLVSDVGTYSTRQILEIIHQEFDKGTLKRKDDMIRLIQNIFLGIFHQNTPQINWQENTPTVIMFIGVNGSGKTTSIGKLSHQLKKEGKKVLVAACDTFRAAAVEQLKIWTDRARVDIYAKSAGADPSATAFEATQKAIKDRYDVLICDTSGRLHTKKNLMDELSKMKRVIAKNIDTAPHYTILTLDGTSGQNSAKQAKEFKSIIGYDGVVLTKLDSTAKGGMIVGIANEFSVPVYYVGLGEGINDFGPFSPEAYVEGMFSTF